MNSIQELVAKLPAVTSVSITLFDKQQELYPMRDVIFNLQLSFYWWRDAIEDLTKLSTGITIPSTEATDKFDSMVTPTLIGVEDQLEFLEVHLKELSDFCNTYLDNSALPPITEYKVRQGYAKVMEAYFATKISTMYYEQLRNYRK